MNIFEEFQTFVRVVDTGSISRTAERMPTAKSAVSRRISDLLQRLGVQLFHGTTRQLNLTDSGRNLYQHAVQILANLEEAEQAVSQVRAFEDFLVQRFEGQPYVLAQENVRIKCPLIRPGVSPDYQQ